MHVLDNIYAEKGDSLQDISLKEMMTVNLLKTSN